MTHRERLQQAIQQLNDIYEEVGFLRDHSTPEMQAEYNLVRQHLPSIQGILTKIDNKIIPEALAQQEL